MKIASNLPLSILMCFVASIGFSQVNDSVFVFDKYANNVSWGYDFKQLRKIKSANGLGPMYLKYERAISKNLGLGGVVYYLGESAYHEQKDITFPSGEFLSYDERISGFAIMPKVNWHFFREHVKNEKIRKLDVYIGAGIGYGFEYLNKDYLMLYVPPPGTPNSFEDRKETTHFVATEVNLGFRFYALEHFGAFFELGFGTSKSQIGIIYTW
jgi:hypothetical protein